LKAMKMITWPKVAASEISDMNARNIIGCYGICKDPSAATM
jgi:hypothetical protein